MGSAIDRYLSEQKPHKNPIDSLVASSPDTGDINLGDNPVDTLTKQPAPSIVPEKPTIGGMIWDAVKEQGRELVQFGKYALTSPPIMGAPNPFTGGLVRSDIDAAVQGDQEAQKRLDRGFRGGALAASTVVSGGASEAFKLAAGPVPVSLARRALTFATSEALGGATFGAVRPVEGDESRTHAVVSDAIAFPIAGAALHGAFKAVGKTFEGTVGNLGDKFITAMKELDAKQAKAVAAKTVKIAQEITPEGAPPDAVAFAHTQALQQALEPITEKQFQDELAAITPKPTAPVDEEAAAAARVQAARTTPFPGVSGTITENRIDPYAPLTGKLPDLPKGLNKVELNKLSSKEIGSMEGDLRQQISALGQGKDRYKFDDEYNIIGDSPKATELIKKFRYISEYNYIRWKKVQSDPKIKALWDAADKKTAEATRAKEAGNIAEYVRLLSEGNELTSRAKQAQAGEIDIPARITPAEPLAESVVRDGQNKLLRVYHGTSQQFDLFNVDQTSPGNLYGRGAYFTDTPDIAEGYGNKGVNAQIKHLTDSIAEIDQRLKNFNETGEVKYLGPPQQRNLVNRLAVTDQEKQASVEVLQQSRKEFEDDLNKLLGEIGNVPAPNIRPAYLDIKNPFNIDKTYPAEEAAKIIKDAGVTMAVPVDKPLSGQQIYDLIDSMSPGDSRQLFQNAGFDGITHVGGARTGNAPHQVYIAFNKEQIFTPWEVELQRVMAQAAEHPGPVSEAAVADAVAEATVESTPITEVMSESAKAQTAEVTASKAVVESASEPTFLDLYKGDKLAGVADEALKQDNIDPIIEQVADQLKGGIEGIQPTWQQVVADTQPEGSNAWNVLAKLTGDQLNSIENAVKRFGVDQTGAITAKLAVRLALGTTGGVLEMASLSEDDPEKKSLLRYAGGFLALASVMPGAGMQKLLAETQWTRRIIKLGAMDKLMSGGSKEALQTWQGLMTTGRTMAKLAELQLKKVFPDKASQNAFMHVLDRGQTAPEWNLLSPEQQKEAMSHHLLNLNMGKLLQSLGILDDYRENYVRHLLPPDSFHAWRAQWEPLIKAGNFTKARQFETLTEMEQWAKATGREGPIMDPSVVQPYHLIEAYRSIANRQTQSLLERIGLIQPYDPSSAIPSGWRQIKVANLSKKMAPDEAASLLERASAGAGKFGVFDDAFKAIDQVKAVWMRTIMLWAWEHGINVLRGGLAIDGTGIAYSGALRAIKRADPIMLEAAKHGLDLFQKPDFAVASSIAFQRALAKIGQSVPLLGKVGHVIEDLHTRGERALWDRWVPAVGLAAYTKYMRDWVSRTGGKYLVDSPEYIAAARAAAKFGNTAMGKVPELVQDPAAQYIMRQALFSPSWLRTRMSLTAHAAGDLTKIAAGELNPMDATYLKYKLRSVLLGIGATYALSKIFTGKDPKFNPNSSKFYARTGIKDPNGREQGLDMVGWWQDDIKLFSDPFSFFRDRQSPMIRTVGAALNGRDQFGREIVGMDRLENILSSFGPGSETAQSLLSGKAPIKPTDTGYRLTSSGLRDISGIIAVGNVAALPKPMDAMIGKMATKILRVNGLPQNDDRVWQLSRLMRQNFAMSGNLYGGNLTTFIAQERRSYNDKHVLGPLWNHARKALIDMGRD